jgi:hypothetical protein
MTLTLLISVKRRHAAAATGPHADGVSDGVHDDTGASVVHTMNSRTAAWRGYDTGRASVNEGWQDS